MTRKAIICNRTIKPKCRDGWRRAHEIYFPSLGATNLLRFRHAPQQYYEVSASIYGSLRFVCGACCSDTPSSIFRFVKRVVVKLDTASGPNLNCFNTPMSFDFCGRGRRL